MLTITSSKLASLLEESPSTIDMIDVRRVDEYTEVHIPGTKNIPLDSLPLRMSEIDREKQIIFICKSGGRSGQACELTESEGIHAYNLVGGMIDFEKSYPTRVIRS